jgi:purine-nucleoside phosphorylase
VTTLAQRLEGRRPRVLITLGSGLGQLADEIQDPLVLAFRDVGLPDPTVPGHAGRFIAGELHGVQVLAQQGRLHLYEGVAVRDVTAPVRAAAEVGVDTFLVTNAAGGIGADTAAGDILVLRDHLNLTATSPLIGAGGAPQFVDMADAYDPHLRKLALTAGERVGVGLSTGVYAGLIGPAYETPAEIAMLRTLGADAVGMSTVAEVIAARALGLRVCGFSLLTNVHRAGGTPTDHAEVLAAAASGGPRLASVLREMLPQV